MYKTNIKHRFKTIALFCGLLLLTGITAAQAQSRFFESAQDIPLKDGLIELHEQALRFDKPQGRIIDVVAQIQNGTDKDILSYYKQSLPQLGWSAKHTRAQKTLNFTRGKESLKISIENFENERFLRVLVEPQ